MELNGTKQGQAEPNKDIKDALFISAKLLSVANFNQNAVKKLCGKLYRSKETQLQAMTKFYNPRIYKKTGRIDESQFVNELNAKKYPSGTVTKKMEYQYSLAKSQGLVSSTDNLIQFPLVLAWAVTLHKFQGQAVKYPLKLVID